MKQELDKCVLVIDEAMPRGLAANTAAILACQRFCCRAGYAGNTGYTACCTFAGEMFFKDTAVIIFFFILWGIDREAPGRVFHLFITYGSSGYFF